VKAVLHLPSDIKSWFAPGTAPDVIRASAFALTNSSILQCASDRASLAHQVDFSKLPTAIAQYFEVILKESIFDREENPKFADHSIPDLEGFEHVDLELVNELNLMAVKRSEVFKIGKESKEQLYERTVGVPASLAKRIVVLDPYAGTALMDRRSDRIWLLRRLIESGCKALHIVTTIPELGNKGYVGISASKRKRLIEGAISDLVAETGARISSEVYFPDKAKFHNRRLKFQFEGGVLGCLLEKGIDGFASPAIESGSAVKPLSGKELSEAIKGIAELKRVPG
jgi:hypothetical protein